MKTYKEFWTYYLSQHKNKICRWLHFFGITCAIIVLIVGLFLSKIWFVPLAFCFGYIPAWFGHFIFEKNVPATFQYPIWSLRADLQMYVLMFTRKI